MSCLVAPVVRTFGRDLVEDGFARRMSARIQGVKMSRLYLALAITAVVCAPTGCADTGPLPYEGPEAELDLVTAPKGSDWEPKGADKKPGTDNGHSDPMDKPKASGTSDLLDAQDFNVFVFSDYWDGHHVGGRVACGGTLAMTRFGIGHGVDGGPVVIARGLELSQGTIYGHAMFSHYRAVEETVDFQSGGELQKAAPINWHQAKWRMKTMSAAMTDLNTNCETEVTEAGEWNQIALRGKHKYLNVFHVTADDLSESKGVTIDCPKGSTVVVNVSGDYATMNNFAFWVQGTVHTNVIYNFYEAEQLDIYGIEVLGSVIAPKANVWFCNGQMRGTLISRGLEGDGEFHNHPFTGSLPW